MTTLDPTTHLEPKAITSVQVHQMLPVHKRNHSPLAFSLP